MKVNLFDGAAHIPDAEVVRVGFWRNPRLAEASAMNPDIPPYRGTYLVTLNCVHKQNVDRLKGVAAEGGDIRQAMVVASINVNGEASPRIPIEGEKIKLATLLPVRDQESGEPVFHKEGVLAGRQVFNARLVEFYPVAAVETLDLNALLNEGSQEAPQPIGTPTGEAIEVG